jgi:hypothetical protein
LHVANFGELLFAFLPASWEARQLLHTTKMSSAGAQILPQAMVPHQLVW